MTQTSDVKCAITSPSASQVLDRKKESRCKEIYSVLPITLAHNINSLTKNEVLRYPQSNATHLIYTENNIAILPFIQPFNVDVNRMLR